MGWSFDPPETIEKNQYRNHLTDDPDPPMIGSEVGKPINITYNLLQLVSFHQDPLF